MTMIIVGPHPLFRISVAKLLRESAVGSEVREAASLNSLPVAERHRARALIVCGGLPPWTDHPAPVQGRSGSAVVLFSDRFGARHRKLLSDGQVDLILPMSVTWQDAAHYLRRLLVSGELGVGFRASYDPCLIRCFRPDVSDLTNQEQRIVDHLQQGLSNGAIADRMAITINTVKVHMARICRKTGAQNRTQITRMFQQLPA